MDDIKFQKTDIGVTPRISTTTPQYSSTTVQTSPNAGHEEDEYSSVNGDHYDEGSVEEGSHNGVDEPSEGQEEDTQTVISVVTNSNNVGDIEPSKPGPGLGVETELDDNDVSESNQILKAKKPNVDTPNSIEIQHRESAVARLNLGKDR